MRRVRRAKLGTVALLTALMVLVALPGCFWRGGGERHEDHHEGDRHDEGHGER